DMAMTAGLIALAPDVDLKGFQARAAQGQTVVGRSLFKAIHESGEMIARSGCHCIPILRGQEGAPVSLGVHVGQLTQQVKGEAPSTYPLRRFGKDIFSAPGNVPEKV